MKRKREEAALIAEASEVDRRHRISVENGRKLVEWIECTAREIDTRRAIEGDLDP